MKKLLAALLIIVFTAFTVLTAVIQSVRSVLLDAELLKQELREAKVYDLAIDLAIESVQKNSDDFEDVVPLLGAEEITSALRSVVSSANIQAQTEAAIDEMYAWFDSSTDLRDRKVVFSLGEIKTRAGSIAMTLLQDKFNRLTPCTPEQLGESRAEDVLNSGLCRPPDVVLTDLIQEADVTTAFQQLPDQIDIIELISESGSDEGTGQVAEGTRANETFQRLNAARDRIRQGVEALKTLTVILLLIWLLIVAFSTRSARAFFAWTGIPVLLAGIALVAPSVFLVQDATTRINAVFSRSELPEAAQSLMTELTEDIVTIIFASVRTKGIFLGSIGFFFLIIALFIPPPKKPKKKKDEAPPPQKLTLHEKLGLTSTAPPPPAGGKPT